MNLRALRYFVSVAQIGSITRAADLLNVAQPAISRQLRQLEEELDTVLFRRHARGIELTQSGMMLFERAQSIIQILQHTAEDLHRPVASEVTRLSVGLPPSTGLLLAADLVRRFQREAPGIALNLKEGIGSTLIEWLLDERLDLAVVHNPPRHPSLWIEPLVSERMVLVLPPASVVLEWSVPRGGETTLRDIGRLPLILPSLPHTNRLFLDSVTARGGEYLRPSMEIDSVAITKHMVAIGLGATILTYAAVHSDVEAGRLRIMMIDNPPLISTLALAGPVAHARSEAVAKARQLINASMATLIGIGAFKGALGTSGVLANERTSPGKPPRRPPAD